MAKYDALMANLTKKNKRTAILPCIYIETSKLQIEFYSRVAFHNWLF